MLSKPKVSPERARVRLECARALDLLSARLPPDLLGLVLDFWPAGRAELFRELARRGRLREARALWPRLAAPSRLRFDEPPETLAAAQLIAGLSGRQGWVGLGPKGALGRWAEARAALRPPAATREYCSGFEAVCRIGELYGLAEALAAAARRGVRAEPSRAADKNLQARLRAFNGGQRLLARWIQARGSGLK